MKRNRCSRIRAAKLKIHSVLKGELLPTEGASEAVRKAGIQPDYRG